MSKNITHLAVMHPRNLHERKKIFFKGNLLCRNENASVKPCIWPTGSGCSVKTQLVQIPAPLTAVSSNNAPQASDCDERGPRQHPWVVLQVADETWTPERTDRVAQRQQSSTKTTDSVARGQQGSTETTRQCSITIFLNKAHLGRSPGR